MTDFPRAAAIRGTKMRWAWTDGPTKGKTHEHVFHQDGTVEWREVEREPSLPASYLAPSGFTLTVVLNQETHEIVGFASGAGQWHPVRGRFELVR
jgi:hypothetical protein